MPLIGYDVFFDRCYGGLRVILAKANDGSARLLHFSSAPFSAARVEAEGGQNVAFRLVEVQCTGADHECLHGSKHMGSGAGNSLPIYVGYRYFENDHGDKLEVVQQADGLHIVSHFQFYGELPVARCWTELRNQRAEQAGVEYVSSFSLFGWCGDGMKRQDEVVLHYARHAWRSEFQWERTTLREAGLASPFTRSGTSGASTQRIVMGTTGSWAARELLPMAVLECAASREMLFWQVETIGSWNWEISEDRQQLCVLLSGPSELENHFWKNLAPGKTFSSVPVAVGAATGAVSDAFNALNAYRRAMRKPHADLRELPVIFNDYMNCLNADATTEKLLPLIDRAAELGAEYFVIDGGWYGDGFWWDSVGEWLPSLARFPGGIEEPIDYIRTKGMIPGLWLEIERMGVKCPLAKTWPDDCFFMRHDRRVVDRGSYQLDFRHPIVIAHANDVVRRVVEGYGVGFIKMDYNIDIGAGTEVSADSSGDGLLEHQRAYKQWLLDLYDRYPGLIIEQCSSGGLRLTYGLMDVQSLCSTSDQEDYRLNARIAINCATGVCPEQAGVWVYPLATSDDEEVIMNMVSALSWRPYLSGQMHRIQDSRLDLVREAIGLYKGFRREIPAAALLWPLGLATLQSGWGAFGLRWNDRILLSVWRFDAPDARCEMAFPELAGKKVSLRCMYPKGRPVQLSWDILTGTLGVELVRNHMARVVQLFW